MFLTAVVWIVSDAVRLKYYRTYFFVNLTLLCQAKLSWSGQKRLSDGLNTGRSDKVNKCHGRFWSFFTTGNISTRSLWSTDISPSSSWGNMAEVLEPKSFVENIEKTIGEMKTLYRPWTFVGWNSNGQTLSVLHCLWNHVLMASCPLVDIHWVYKVMKFSWKFFMKRMSL